MDLNGITQRIIGCAINVHKELGPGLLESIYESAMLIELRKCSLFTERQKKLVVRYDGVEIGEHRLDILVEKTVVVELKSVERFDPVFQAQLLSYLKLGGYPIGLLINFNARMLKHGIKRMTIQ